MTVRLVMPWGDIIDMVVDGDPVQPPASYRVPILRKGGARLAPPGIAGQAPVEYVELTRDQELSVSAGMWVYL